MMKSPFQLFEYWHTCASSSGADSSAGYATAENHPGDLQRVVRDDPCAGVRVERRSVVVEADLEAPSVEVRQAVDAAGEIDPRRHRRGCEPPVTRLRTEEEDLLSCRVDTVTEHCWEQLGEPGPAGEHERAGCDPVAVACVHRLDMPGVGRWRDRRHAVVDTLLDRPTHDRLHGASSHDHAPVRFEHAAGDRAEGELGISLFELGPVECLEWYPQPSQRLDGVVGGGVVPSCHPQDPGLREQFLTPVPGQLPPGVERAPRPFRVDRLAAIPDAKDTRGATGARPGVPGAERVDQRDRPATPSELEGRPGAKHAGADHGDIGCVRHQG